MNIGFDARFMAVPGGLGRYCSELLTHLTTRFPDDTFTILARELPTVLAKHSAHFIPCSTPWYGFAEQTSLGLAMNRIRDVELWHIPHWNVPLLLRRPFVMTIHDTIAEKFSTHDGSLRWRWRYFLKRVIWRWLLGYNIRRARAIIIVSRTVRDELAARFPHAARKMTVIHNGVSFVPPSGINEQRINERHQHSPYFLIVGNSYPHKNHGVVFRAFEQLATQHPTVHLHIVTHEDRFSRAAAVQASTQQHAGRIHFLFDASDDLLAEQYAGAHMLIFPSLAEGFGLPPLEALRAGTPVLCVQTPIAREILGEHVSWMDPHDANALARQLFDNLRMPRRASAEAQLHAHTFTWDAAAVATRTLYETVI